MAGLCICPNVVVYARLSRYIGQRWTNTGVSTVARRIRESILDSRDARLKLKVRGKPYWRSIGAGLHVGYRKGKDARRWVARIYVGAGQYVVESIGYADDFADADGVIGQAYMRGIAIGLTEDSDRGDSHLLAGTNNAERDLSAIGD